MATRLVATRACLHCLQIVPEHAGCCPLCGGRFARPIDGGGPAKGASAFFESLNANRVYSVLDDGSIIAMTWEDYESLADDDPKLARIYAIEALAIRARNRILGLQDGPQIWTQ